MKKSKGKRVFIMGLLRKTLTVFVGIFLISSIAFARGREGHEGSPGATEGPAEAESVGGKGKNNDRGSVSVSPGNHGSDSRGPGSHGYGRASSGDQGVSAPDPDKSTPDEKNSNSKADKNNPTGSKATIDLGPGGIMTGVGLWR